MNFEDKILSAAGFNVQQPQNQLAPFNSSTPISIPQSKSSRVKPRKKTNKQKKRDLRLLSERLQQTRDNFEDTGVNMPEGPVNNQRPGFPANIN